MPRYPSRNRFGSLWLASAAGALALSVFAPQVGAQGQGGATSGASPGGAAPSSGASGGTNASTPGTDRGPSPSAGRSGDTGGRSMSGASDRDRSASGSSRSRDSSRLSNERTS